MSVTSHSEPAPQRTELEEQRREIQEILERTGLTVEEMAERVAVKAETMRKYAQGYQKAGMRFMALVREQKKAPPMMRDALTVLEEPGEYGTSKTPSKIAEWIARLAYVLENGRPEEIRIVRAVLDAAYEEIGNRKGRK